MNEQLQLKRIPGNPAENLSDPELESLALLYARVFAAEPWNEYTVCPISGTFYGIQSQPGETCSEPACAGILELAYPLIPTMEYIRYELSRDEAALWLLRKEARDNEIVGFTWGFVYDSPETFASAKYRTPEMQVTISGLLRQLELGTNGLWYLSESGIENDSRYRGQGWSREFHQQRLTTARSLGLAAVQRTSAYSSMYRTSKRFMTQIMGTEVDIGNNGEYYSTGRMVNHLPDTEIEGRVLFAKAP